MHVNQTIMLQTLKLYTVIYVYYFLVKLEKKISLREKTFKAEKIIPGGYEEKNIHSQDHTTATYMCVCV